MVNWLPLATAVLGLAPAAVLFFVAYGRFDGLFRDNVVFLWFMGGMGLGAVLALVAVYMGALFPLLLATLVPLLYAVVFAALLNRKKWQGERHSVFNGGALGLGAASMTSFAFLYREIELAPRIVAEWTLLSAALAGALFAAGAVVGAGVADRKPLRSTALALGSSILAFATLNEYLQSGAALWPIIALVTGAVPAFLAATRVLPRGVERGALKRARRTRA